MHLYQDSFANGWRLSLAFLGGRVLAIVAWPVGVVWAITNARGEPSHPPCEPLGGHRSFNAPAESVFATLKGELFDPQPGGRFTTRHEAGLAVLDYLETFYNPRRRHFALGLIAPATFEARHTLTTAA